MAETDEGVTREDADAIQPGTVMALVAMGLGVFVIANDFTALNVALPAIEGDLDADVGSVQWVINAYALVFGMAIVSVSPAIRPLTTDTAPNSPIARALQRMTP